MLIFPPPTGASWSGKGEFPIEVVDAEGSRARRPVDVLGARWRNQREVEIAAIELKATRWAAYDALGQAVQYQTVCDEVVIGTPQNVDADPLVRATLADLGLGYVQVDEAAARAFLTIAPWPRKGVRFQPEEKARRVACRLAPGLAFLEVTTPTPIAYGFSGGPNLSAWYAESVHENLQWNCWHRCADDVTGAGINVEFTQDIRTILKNVDRGALWEAMRPLPKHYRLAVEFCPVPSNPRIANDLGPTGAACQPGIMEAVLGAASVTPSKRRAQVFLQHELQRSEWSKFTRQDYVDWIGQVQTDLRPTMDVIRASYH